MEYILGMTNRSASRYMSVCMVLYGTYNYYVLVRQVSRFIIDKSHLVIIWPNREVRRNTFSLDEFASETI